MSTNRLINDSILSDIGDAIREKCETTTMYKPQDMAAAIRSIPKGSSGKNIQASFETPPPYTEDSVVGSLLGTNSTSYQDTGLGLTVKKSGIYNIFWAHGRSATSGNFGSRLFINGIGYGREFTQFLRSYQCVFLYHVRLNEGDVLSVRGYSSYTSYTLYVSNLVIIEV